MAFAPRLLSICVALAVMPLHAQGQPDPSAWYVMARHGECLAPAAFGALLSPAGSAAPEAGPLTQFTTPQAFAAAMRQRGHTVTTDAPPQARGHLVTVAYQAPGADARLPTPTLVFVQREMCHSGLTR